MTVQSDEKVPSIFKKLIENNISCVPVLDVHRRYSTHCHDKTRGMRRSSHCSVHARSNSPHAIRVPGVIASFSRHDRQSVARDPRECSGGADAFCFARFQLHQKCPFLPSTAFVCHSQTLCCFGVLGDREQAKDPSVIATESIQSSSAAPMEGIDATHQAATSIGSGADAEMKIEQRQAGTCNWRRWGRPK